MNRFAPSIVAARLRAATIGFSVVVPLGWMVPGLIYAQEQADPVVKAVEDFWHFGKIARYDLAAIKADEILSSGASPSQILQAFEKVAGDRGDKLDEWMIRWQGVDSIKDKATELAKRINEGRFERRSNPDHIIEQVKRLSGGDRPYRLAMVQLRESGELAVPFLLDVLKDPTRNPEHGAVRQAILDLGRLALNPLVAATESDQPAVLQIVCSLLGDLGYDAATPYLQRLVETSPDDQVKQLAKAAVTRLGGASTSAGNLFYDLAEKLYYGKSALTADTRFPTANIWRYEQGQKGLVRTQVPLAIYNDLMAMRATEYALALGTDRDALSLWLASNFRREVDLPAGETDRTRAEGQPSAHFYGVTAGAQYLNSALARALKDRNSPLALSVVKSLQEIVGDSNFRTNDSTPLIDAMQYGDRRVRFEAAFTLAQALPQSGFTGQEMVVPLLAEAISQTGQPSVLVVMPTVEGVNAVVEPLKADNFIAAGATTPAAALSAAASLPAIDVVVISDDLSPADIESLLGLIAQTPKVRGAGKLIVVKSQASPWEQRKVTDPSISTTTATDASGLKSAIQRARDASGALPLDPVLATEYATRAGELIKKLAISRGQVLDLTPAQSTLLGSLEDARPQIVQLAGQALALLNTADAQRGLAIKATSEGIADDVKVSLLKSLATSAKFFGNRLEAAQLDSLETVVRVATNPDVKNAAAEARGALNLPSDQARTLILEQSRR